MKREPAGPQGRRLRRWRGVWRRRVARPEPATRRRVRRRRLRIAVAAVAALLLGAAIAYYMLRPPEVAVDVVRRADVVRMLAMTGEIDARWTVQVVPVVTGELELLTAREGERVEAGQLLARVDAGEPLAARAQAAEALAARRVELEQARRELERARRLFGGGALAEQELEQARLAVEQGERQVAELEAAVTEREARLEDYLIRAPMDAVVLERPVDPGQVVGPETTIYDLAAVGGRGVEALVDERYITDLVLGLPAVVTPVGEDAVYRARVTYISDQVDPETGAATVRLRFVGPPPPLPFGLSVDVNLAVARHPNALTVARAAVVGPGESLSWVYVVEDGVVERRRVRVIDWPAERVVVVEGLEAGEQVVLVPRRVEPGERVRPEPVDP